MASTESHVSSLLNLAASVTDKVEEPSITASVKEEPPERKDYQKRWWFHHEDGYKGVVERLQKVAIEDIEKHAVKLGKSFDVASIHYAQLMAENKFPKEWDDVIDGASKKQLARLSKAWMKECFLCKAAFTYATFEHERRMRNMEELFWAMKLNLAGLMEGPKIKPVTELGSLPLEVDEEYATSMGMIMSKEDCHCTPVSDPETKEDLPPPEKPTVILDLTKEEDKTE